MTLEQLDTPFFKDLLERIHKIGQKTVAVYAPDVDEKARFPHEAFEAFKEEKLLSCYVPESYGGMGLDIVQVSKICEVLGNYCGSTAMVFAMHQIQVACVVNHALDSEYFRNYTKEIVDKQLLIASATTEMGVGGDLRSSICAVEVEGDTFTLVKQAPVISYGEAADDILVTCRKSPDAAKSDQVHVLVRKGSYELEPLAEWDTMGFRGTCSAGFVLSAKGDSSQIIGAPFIDILAVTMHPVSHIVWSALWLGLSNDAVNRARKHCKASLRKNPDAPQIASLRLAEVSHELTSMRNNTIVASCEYLSLLKTKDKWAFESFGFAIRTNNLKLATSKAMLSIVNKTMTICGISGYRNDSKLSLCRHLRDAHGAELMVHNDRILNHNSNLLLITRDV